MDEFAIYRGILSEAEILEHYNNGDGKYYAGASSGGLLASYKPPDLAAQPETAVMVLPAGAVTRTYYYAGGQRVAMRENGTLFYLLGDHLGSTAYTANSSGTRVAELRYKAWGRRASRKTWHAGQGKGKKFHDISVKLVIKTRLPD